jgi:hypothetical protein
MSGSADNQATASGEHLRTLLREKDPGFFAVLELAVARVDAELSSECLEIAPR